MLVKTKKCISNIANSKLRKKILILVRAVISLFLLVYIYLKIQPYRISFNDTRSHRFHFDFQKSKGKKDGREKVSNSSKNPMINILMKETKSYSGQDLKAALPFKSSLSNYPAQVSLKIILMWNEWNVKLEDEPLPKVQCPITSCLFTTDLSLIQHSDVVVLHFDTLKDFPINRKPHQRFVFYHFESPVNTVTKLMDNPYFRYDYFNWTMTYRRDSDIFLRDYYGSLVSKKSSNDNNRKTRYQYGSYKSRNNSIEVDDDGVVGYQNNDPGLYKLISRKTKMITWFVGNCNTAIRREEYVRQLNQYVPIDIFGKCTEDCSTNCDEMLKSDYKFYLAFENSWCPDYITEKFSRPLLYDAIPVVLGGADYSRFAPPNSYINARDFSSPKELAEYLMLLNRTDSLYASYFHWKNDFYISVPDMYGWCELCIMANDRNLPPKVYHDIKKWWMVGGGDCESNSTEYF